jgi:hypothetical protein
MGQSALTTESEVRRVQAWRSSLDQAPLRVKRFFGR